MVIQSVMLGQNFLFGQLSIIGYFFFFFLFRSCNTFIRIFFLFRICREFYFVILSLQKVNQFINLLIIIILRKDKCLIVGYKFLFDVFIIL